MGCVDDGGYGALVLKNFPGTDQKIIFAPTNGATFRDIQDPLATGEQDDGYPRFTALFDQQARCLAAREDVENLGAEISD